MIINKYIKPIIALLITVTAISCNQTTFDSKEDLLEYIKNPENGYYQEKSVNGIDFSLLYKPTDLMVSQEISENPTKREVDSLRQKYNRHLYYTLSMSKNNKELLSVIPTNKTEFSSLVEIFAFYMATYIKIETHDNNSVEILDYIYERTYSEYGKTRFLLILPKNNNSIKKIELRSFPLLTENLVFITKNIEEILKINY